VVIIGVFVLWSITILVTHTCVECCLAVFNLSSKIQLFVPAILRVCRTTVIAYHLSVLIMLGCYLIMIDCLCKSLWMF